MDNFDQRVAIAARIRSLRQSRGISAEKMAELLDVSTQQVYKYEHAQTRIPAEMLGIIAFILSCGVANLFEEPAADTPAPVAPAAWEAECAVLYGKMNRRQRALVLDLMENIVREAPNVGSVG